MPQETPLVIGIFYEAPDGRIAKSYGWEGKAGLVSAYFDDDAGSFTVAEKEFRTDWKPRPDLGDFPNARDPRLPYVFDLFWDIKRRSELLVMLASGEDHEEVTQTMGRHGVVLSEAEVAKVAELQAALANDAAIADPPFRI